MSNDPIQAWLNAAGRFPLLPKSEIIRLAKKRDTYEVGSKGYIKIVNKICEHNLRLVPGVVRNYVGKRSRVNMTSDITSDLLQQGYMGLRRAAEKYDGTRGFTFSTYAFNWISQCISRWHNTAGRMVYIPESTQVELLYRQRHGQPSKSKNGKIRQELLNCAMRSMDVASIDKRLGDSGDDDVNSIADIMSDENRLISTTSAPEGKAELELKDLMAECGIKPRTQDIVITYAKRGRMSIVASRLSLSPKHCQNLYQEAVRTMKAKVAEKEAAKAARLAVRLAK